MSRWSGRRGQVEPLAALVAVLAVGAALALYADVLLAAEPSPTGPGTADATLQRVATTVSDGAVALPARVPRAVDAGPAGRPVNVTLSAGDRTWTVGPTPPPDASNASRPASVRLRPGRVQPGRLRVVVWT